MLIRISLFLYYLTRAVRSRERGPACLPAALLCPSFVRGSSQLITSHFSGGDCECLTISVPSQIAVDCKSVHFKIDSFVPTGWFLLPQDGKRTVKIFAIL